MEVQIGKTKYNVTFGSVLFVLTTLVAIIGTYVTLQTNIATMQKDIENLQAQVEEVKENYGATGIIELRGLLDVTSTKLNYIEKTLDALDSAIR